MKQDELLLLTENLIKDYLHDGDVAGLSMLLDEDAVAYSHLHMNYIRGSWDVRRFMLEQYERLEPLELKRCKYKYSVTGEGGSVVAKMVLTCTKARRLVFLDMIVMYRCSEDDCPVITGVYFYRAYRHENTLRILSGRSEEYLNAYDELTGIYNKQSFYEHAREMIQENADKRFNLLRINVERFKVLNDLFGEATGDQLLRYIGGFLKELNLPLCVAGRLYADNFAVCYEAGKGDSRRLISTMQMMADSFALNHRTVLSFGLYRIDDNTLPVSVMCDRANMALWKAKGSVLRV